MRERVLARYGEQYGDYGPTLAAECLQEEGLVVTVETLRRWLLLAGQWSRQRRSKLHRRRRDRKEQFGELVDATHARGMEIARKAFRTYTNTFRELAK